MDLITPQTYKGSVLALNRFWVFFFIVCLFWISQAVIYSLGDSICFDQLGKDLKILSLYSKMIVYILKNR